VSGGIRGDGAWHRRARGRRRGLHGRPGRAEQRPSGGGDSDDALIGTTGAAISHGCIRLHDADLAQLSVVPAGTPIDIVS
jgi:hypothetical protein